MPAHDITAPAFSYDSGYVTISTSQYLEKTSCQTCQGFDPALRLRAEGSLIIRHVPAISTTVKINDDQNTFSDHPLYLFRLLVTFKVPPSNGTTGQILTCSFFVGPVDISKLAQTFQDAIHLVRRLGIPYLWIDSLCIIQDDKEDWRAEASRMCSVYENAHLTIAATWAKDGSHGLYSDDASSYYVGRKIATIDGHEVYVRRAINHQGLHVYLDHRDRADYPLLGRGWVYQERLLSRRFLQFSRFELTWECLGGDIRCQCGYERWTGGLLMKQTYFATLQQLTRDQGGGDTESAAWSRAGMGESWHHIVSHYSGLALSHTSDRFSALAGLAYRFREALADDYLAGLWRGSLVQDLQWRALGVGGGRRVPPRPTGPWRAPSWSWAAVDCPVDYDRPPTRMLQDACDVLAAQCDFVDGALSELQAGFVRLRGLLVRNAVLEVREEGGGNVRMSVAGVELRYVWLDYARPAVCGMPVTLFRITMLDVGDFEHTKWLILCCVDGKPGTTYERIGIAAHFLMGSQSVDLEGATVEEIIIV
ncbi:uncharacterized protein DNG_08617 [Cephalotrichum gorgonifer]|uniref:Heterokaryon incompatibility domain-containing protein n=1 Tax=Cephalotrichum gorgonifer TaxID=2041049 RepID=A0AAE8N5X2_9PEZI|nr:uncharacterized protein DNG_08617 [Cephalotrichum gorgonifer]